MVILSTSGTMRKYFHSTRPNFECKCTKLQFNIPSTSQNTSNASLSCGTRGTTSRGHQYPKRSCTLSIQQQNKPKKLWKSVRNKGSHQLEMREANS